MLQTHLANCIENHVPLRKMTVKEIKLLNKPWISVGLQNNITYRDQLAREIRVENKPHLIPFYNKFRKRLEKKLFRAKQEHFQKKIKIAKTNSRNIWKAINEITSRKNSNSKYPTKIKLKCGDLTVNPKEIANTLNDYFINIGPDLARNIEPSIKSYGDYMSGRSSNSFFLSPTDPSEIITVLKNFSSKKSTGPDNIPCKILKLGSRSLSPILNDLINECF